MFAFPTEFGIINLEKKIYDGQAIECLYEVVKMKMPLWNRKIEQTVTERSYNPAEQYNRLQQRHWPNPVTLRESGPPAWLVRFHCTGCFDINS